MDTAAPVDTAAARRTELVRLRLSPGVVRGVVDRTRTTALFEQHARRAPYAGLLKAAGRTELVVSDPGLAREVLVTQGRSFGKGYALRQTRFLLGDGLLTADRELHRRQRPVVQPAFSRTRIASYAQDMVAAAQEHMAAWRPGQVVDMAAEMQRLTLAAVGTTLLGTRTGAQAASRVGPALATALRAWEVALLPGMAWVRESRLPGAVRTRAAIAELDDLVRTVVGDARRRGGGDDVVSALLGSQADPTAADDTQVRDEVMTLLLAGHETTANALTWTLHLLSDAPHVAARLRRSLDALGRTPAYEDLPALPYAYAVVAEAMRLYPPAWILEREALEDVEVGGIRVPRGGSVVMCTWVLHRDPRSWVAPLAFRPERWLDEQGAFDEAAPGQPRGAWQPFGGGTRRCIGESFAWTEAVLLLCVLLGAYAPVREPDQRVATRAAVTLRPAYGMRMRLLPV